MPEDREQRSRTRQRRQASRRATRAIRSAVAELTPTQRARLQSTGFQAAARVVSPEQARKQTGVGASAFATTPRISFTAQKGRLVAGDVLTTARHEVAHIIGGTKGGAPGVTDPFALHLTLRAAGSQESAVGLRSTPGIKREPFGRQMTMARQRRSRFPAVRRLVRPAPKPLTSKVDTRGFQTPHLQTVAETGTAAQQRQARTQMRRLGQRLKGRVDF